MLPRKILVDDQNLRTTKTQETALMIVAVAAMAGGHSDQNARIDPNARIGLNAKIDPNVRIRISILSRYPEKKTKRPNSSYLN